MTKKKEPTPQMMIEVAMFRSVEDILTHTKGLLKLIEVACNAASRDDGEEVTAVFGPDLLKSLPMLCCMATQDLGLVELYLGADASSFHRNQIEEMAMMGRRMAGGVR